MCEITEDEITLATLDSRQQPWSVSIAQRLDSKTIGTLSHPLSRLQLSRLVHQANHATQDHRLQSATTYPVRIQKHFDGERL